MSRTLRIVERARADVDGIFNWLARRSPKGAIAWYMAFRSAVRRIADSEENLGRAAEAEQLHRELREVLFKTRRGRIYRIVFEITEDEIVVLRVRGPGQAPLRDRDLAE